MPKDVLCRRSITSLRFVMIIHIFLCGEDLFKVWSAGTFCEHRDKERKTEYRSRTVFGKANLLAACKRAAGATWSSMVGAQDGVNRLHKIYIDKRN